MKVATELEKASNIYMEETRVTAFREQVLAGDFENVPQMVDTFVKGSMSSDDYDQFEHCEIMKQKREFMQKE